MKKHFFVSSAFMIIALAIALPVFAKEGLADSFKKSSTTPRAIILEHRLASSTLRLNEIKKNIELRKASSTEHRIEKRQALAKSRVENVTKIMNATIVRLEKIITRIESRIKKIKTKGGDTTEAENLVTLAKGNLSDAKVAVETFSQLDLSGTNALDNSETIRAAAAEARDDIQAARQNLMMAVRSLKGPNTGLEKGEKATSTTE